MLPAASRFFQLASKCSSSVRLVLVYTLNLSQVAVIASV